MFWGITLESGKKYTQILQRSFCVTMAALGFENPSNDCVYVVAEVNKAQHVLCSLQYGTIPQQVLNLSFTEGEHVSFYIEGEGQVHLTGYLTPEEEEDSDLSDVSSDENDHDRSTQDSGAQSNHVSETNGNSATNEVSDISWQGILSGSQEKGVSTNNDSQHMGNTVANEQRDALHEGIYVDDNNISNECINNLSPIANDQGLDCSYDCTNDERTTMSSDDGDTTYPLSKQDEKPSTKCVQPTGKKKKKGDKNNKEEIKDPSSSDSETKYMLVEKEKKPVTKRKRSSSVKPISDTKETSATTGKKARGKPANIKKVDNAVQKKAQGKSVSKKKVNTSTKKKSASETKKTARGRKIEKSK